MLEFDLVPIAARRLTLGQPLVAVKAAWRVHRDLALPWRYFAKETGEQVVDVGAFSIQRCPLTWAELRALAPDLAARLGDGANGAEPADGLTHLEACWMAELAAERTGLPLRLPSEAEWERAARGSDDRAYPWGDEFDPSACNLTELGAARPLPVGSLVAGASEDGLLDMAGNVDEWTSTRFAPFPNAHWTVAPTEPWALDPHVTRGGSWSDCRDLARSRRRHSVYPPHTGAGLRLAMDGQRATT